ncbi:MAG: glycosyltransferase family 2 protein, partial [Rhodocyclaceae bacterium]|nr:glycosyltransferase family 2 protein [Rhodocyclaceae bacterium]
MALDIVCRQKRHSARRAGEKVCHQYANEGKDVLNIVIPMAGAGSRFAKAGYDKPKPLIEVRGVPMIRLVIENLRPRRPHRFVFVVQRQHAQQYGLPQKLRTWAGSTSEIVMVDGLTQGAACTVLAAQRLIDNEEPLMIANSDQWVDVDIDDYLDFGRAFDGFMMTMKADDPKWSYVGLDAAGCVTRVVEKEVISNEATVGIYNYRQGGSFVRAAQAMISANERVNNEFYVAPVYNRMIAAGARVGIYNVGSEACGMYGLGIPADLELFLRLPACDKALAR